MTKQEKYLMIELNTQENIRILILYLFYMKTSIPVLSKKPINLMKLNCQKIMSQINQEYVPTQTNFHSPIKPKKKKNQHFTFALSTIEQYQTINYNDEPKLPEIRRQRNDSFNQSFKLHVDIKKSEDGQILSLEKWQGPKKRSQSPARRSTKILPPVNVNYKQRNSQSLMVLRSQQLEEMKKLQRLIKDVLTKQDHQMNHHFDSLQQELSE
ncbi:unnamed protein product [Paramecium octaurelia]|uniref:Uncharacterized protein n=1 Tax=Paramecium octaurelia TaxID=43137 RepID=A0A8S1SQY2_PAROT|nr:unnamed protein product [Paramecium octaurelia]